MCENRGVNSCGFFFFFLFSLSVCSQIKFRSAVNGLKGLWLTWPNANVNIPGRSHLSYRSTSILSYLWLWYLQTLGDSRRNKTRLRETWKQQSRRPLQTFRTVTHPFWPDPLPTPTPPTHGHSWSLLWTRGRQIRRPSELLITTRCYWDRRRGGTGGNCLDRESGKLIYTRSKAWKSTSVGRR